MEYFSPTKEVAIVFDSANDLASIATVELAAKRRIPFPNILLETGDYVDAALGPWYPYD